MRALCILTLAALIVSCARYAYVETSNGQLTLTPEGDPEWAYTTDKSEAQAQTLELLKVRKVRIPVQNVWQGRILGAGMALGAALLVLGILIGVIASMPKQGALVGAAGVMCVALFTVLQGYLAWIQNNLLLAGFGIVLVGATVWYFYFSRGTQTSLIESFEAQKDKVWGEETEQTVKTIQGRFQEYIARQRKKLVR